MAAQESSGEKIRNEMLYHTLGGGVILFSLQHFIAPALDLLSCLQARGTRDCNKDSKFKRGTMKCSKVYKFCLKS